MEMEKQTIQGIQEYLIDQCWKDEEKKTKSG